MIRDPSVLLVSLLKLPGIIADKVRVHARWPMESCAERAWSFIVRLVLYAPWKDLQHLCVGLVVDCTLSLVRH